MVSTTAVQGYFIFREQQATKTLYHNVLVRINKKLREKVPAPPSKALYSLHLSDQMMSMQSP
jgi:hypothetical protein